MKTYLRLLTTSSLVLLLTGVYGGYSNKKEPVEVKPAPPTSSDVYLSSPSYTFELEFRALALQTYSNSIHYAAEANPLPAPTPNWVIHDIHPGYRFGFDLGCNVVFHATNTNLMLSWERCHSSASNSVALPSSDMLGPFFEIGPDASPYNSSTGHVHFHFDKGNLDYGVLVNFGSRAKINFFAGVGYAYIKQNLTSTYSNPDSTITRSIVVPSSFSGAGPQAGVNFAYRIVKGFHLAGDASAALLIGPMKNHTTYESNSPLLTGLHITPPNKQSITVPSRTQLVPGFEGRLGLCYEYTFCKHYMISLEAGYKAQVYINAVQSVDMGSEVTLNTIAAPTVGVYARTFQRTLSNFALAGPYGSLNLGF